MVVDADLFTAVWVCKPLSTHDPLSCSEVSSPSMVAECIFGCSVRIGLMREPTPIICTAIWRLTINSIIINLILQEKSS